MYQLVRTSLLLAVALAAAAQEPARAPLPLRSPVQDKNFYVLSLLERCEPIHPMLQRDNGPRLKSALNCGPELTCFTRAMLFTDAEIGAADNSLRALQRSSKTFHDCVTAPMRSSGLYQVHSGLSEEDLVSWAWQDAARGINRAIAIYGEGAAPH